MSIFPPLLDVMVQIVSYAGKQSNQLSPFLSWCFSHLTSFDQSTEIGLPAQSALLYIGIQIGKFFHGKP